MPRKGKKKLKRGKEKAGKIFWLIAWGMEEALRGFGSRDIRLLRDRKREEK